VARLDGNLNHSPSERLPYGICSSDSPRPRIRNQIYFCTLREEPALAKANALELPSSNTALTKRYLWFSVWTVFSLFLFIKPVGNLIRLSLSQDDASYLVLIPFISAVVLCLERNRIFAQISFDKPLAGIFLLIATVVALASHFAGALPLLGLKLSTSIIALALLWVSGFAFFFGKAALKAGYFPFLLLLLMVPIPNFLLDRIIGLLQEGSAWITGALFDLMGVPVLREGLVFHLAKATIEVAKECSGIRSSMALLILALLVAHFRLRNFWNKILFVACGLFMMILKNGVRIATLTLLAVYVDPDFLFGRLHHQGGVVFFLLGLVLLLPILWLLQRSEKPLGTIEDSSAA
jgi:exosortase